MCVHLLCTCVYRLYCVCALLFLCIEILMQWQVVFPITNVFILFYTMYIIHIFLYPISLITTEILVRVLVALQLLLSQIRWTILLILGSTMCRIMYVLPLTARSMWWAYWLVDWAVLIQSHLSGTLVLCQGMWKHRTPWNSIGWWRTRPTSKYRKCVPHQPTCTMYMYAVLYMWPNLRKLTFWPQCVVSSCAPKYPTSWLTIVSWITTLQNLHVISSCHFHHSHTKCFNFSLLLMLLTCSYMYQCTNYLLTCTNVHCTNCLPMCANVPIVWSINSVHVVKWMWCILTYSQNKQFISRLTQWVTQWCKAPLCLKAGSHCFCDVMWLEVHVNAHEQRKNRTNF